MKKMSCIVFLLCVACQRESAAVWPTVEPDDVKTFTHFDAPVRWYLVGKAEKSRIMHCGEESVSVGAEPLLDETLIKDMTHETRRRVKQWVWVRSEQHPDWKVQLDVATMEREVRILYGKNAKVEPISAPAEVLEYGLVIQFSETGRKKLHQVTNDFSRKSLAMVIGDQCLSVAKIFEPIASGVMGIRLFNVSQQELSTLLRVKAP